MTNLVKCKGFYIHVEVVNPIWVMMVELLSTTSQKTFILTLETIHRIKIHHEKINLTHFESYHKITNEDIISLSKISNNGNKYDKVSIMWISQRRSRFYLAWAIERLSCDIFKIKALYYAMTCFKGSKIDIHWVLTFFKILSLIIFTILPSLLRNVT
jgi:hypothetical protein